MCGILGIARVGGVPPAALDPIELLRHRGPDSEGRLADGPVAIAMRRLAIIDVPGGDQPLSNESGDVTVVCNGELYNFVELRAELQSRGHRFATGSDVEVVVHLYEEAGDRCFERLRGMFAIALWDERRRRLVLARDRFGIKPLYVAEIAGALAFASEIAPLLALGVPARADPQAIADFLSLGYVPGEATGLLDVRSLAPGHRLVWHDGRTSVEGFTELVPRAPDSLEATLAEAVRIHLRSDVPLAVLLSGGLDSSLIASLAVSELDRPIQTFSVGFGDAAFDELAYARAVADAIGSEHNEVEVRADAAHDLPEIVRRLEEPNGDASAIPLYYVCRAVAGTVKVALAGDGGDEVFGGYSRYAWDRTARIIGRYLPAAGIAAALERVPSIARAAGRSDRKGLVRRAVKLLRHAGLPAPERYFSWFALAGPDLKAELAGSDAAAGERIFTELFERAPASLTELGRLQYVDLNTMLLKDLLVKADRMSMAHSLELRVPFLDNEVVAAGLALPSRQKVRGVQTKRAIRELVARRLPRSIARRPKQGFEVPIDRWLREDLGELAGDLLTPARLARHGLVDAGAARRLFDEHRAGTHDHGQLLYAIVVLELWHDGVVANAKSLAVA
jgi:asparagine synthase (glutamine-hydrolysing)